MLIRKILLFLVACFLTYTNSYALSIGQAKTQGQTKFAIGFESDYTFRREVKDRNINIITTKSGFPTIYNEDVRVKFNRISHEMIKVSGGILNNLDFYAKIGMAKIGRIRSQGSGSGTLAGLSIKLDGRTDYRGKPGLAFGFGLKGNLDLTDNLFLGLDTQYLRSKNSLRFNNWSVISGSVYSAETLSGNGKIIMDEWQLAPYLAYKLHNFTPYLGVKCSYMREKITTNNIGVFPEASGATGKTDYKAGVFIGCDYNLNKKLSLNLEANFIDETALSAGLTYAF